MSANFPSRVRLIAAAVVFAGVLLIGKLYLVQIVQGDEFSARADRQYVRPQSELFERGSIFLKGKDGTLVSAATLKSGFTLSINPETLQGTHSAYEAISKIVPIDSETFFLRASKKDDPYEELARRIPEDKAIAIQELGIEGVSVHKEQWRYYPGGSLAAHTLGFVAFNEDSLEGRYGLENYYQDTLVRGDEPVYVNFFAEIFSNVKTALSATSKHKGDLILTLEPSVQAFLEGQLSDISERWDSASTGGIIINPKTGEIYALAVDPSFNLNDFKDVKNVSSFGNPLVESVFEMGSIIKAITMSIGLDVGAVTPDTTYNDKGYLTLNGSTISNYDGEGRGVVPMQEVLNQSLNTGAAFVASRVGNRKFADYLFDFGIGEETGIDLPGETVGLIDNLSSPRDIEYATASFGQGIAMTPIETVRALAVLGNGGTLITPHVVDKVRDELGYTKDFFYNEGKRVLKKETSEEITRMLVKVVDDALLDGTVKLDRYSIAAKTGTAQIANNNDGGYYDDRYFHSFFGYFPAYDPEFLVFLYTKEPREVRYASQTLTLPFMETAKFLLSYYEIPPDR